MHKLIFAMLLALVADASVAACQMFKPDGSVGPCTPTATRVAASADQASANPCQLGGKLAHDAYLQVTYDARVPSLRLLHYTVDYWGDQMVPKHDREVAHRGVEFIADKLQAAGIIRPWEGVVYEAAREFIIAECK